MTLTELHYIIILAQERHFGRAAERASVTQPALSLAIKKLEEELGVMIVDRGKKNQIALTPLGEQIVQQAQRVVEEADQIKVLASQGKDQLAGPLRLGVIATVGPYLLPQLIPILHKRAPAMPVVIEENLTANLTLMLKSGRLDVLIVALPFNEPGLLSQPLYTEPFQVVVPVSHRWAKKSRIDSRLLATEKVLLPTAGHCFRRQVLEACPEVSRSDTEGIQGNSLETIRLMVSSGLGITVLPCSALTSKHQNRRLVAIKFAEPVPERTIGLAWRKGFIRPLALNVLRESIQSMQVPGVDMC